MGKKKHVPDTDLKGDHKQVKKNTDGGSCLWGTVGAYTQNSCAYRWQSREKAKESAEKKIYHSYRDKLESGEIPEEVPTLAAETKKGGLYPQLYAFKLDRPEPGDWDVEGPIYSGASTSKKKKVVIERDTDDPNSDSGKDKIKEGDNFTKARWPYWNEAHHIVPKASLLNIIDQKTEDEPSYSVVIKKALLKAKYNVNHKTNMMFLPMDKEVGKIISLPRHITLSLDDGPGGVKEFGNHKIYNNEVEKELKLIVDDCISKIKDAEGTGSHPEIDGEFAKDDLEDLSDDLRQVLKDFGKGSAGLPITAIDVTQALAAL